MPKLDGVLETALYTDDMERARAFYEGVMELKPIFEDKRLCAYGIAERSVLLIYPRGGATETAAFRDMTARARCISPSRSPRTSCRDGRRN